MFRNIITPRSLTRDKSPIKMFSKRLYDKPMNIIYHSQIKNKTITAYKPVSGNALKAKVNKIEYKIIEILNFDL